MISQLLSLSFLTVVKFPSKIKNLRLQFEKKQISKSKLLAKGEVGGRNQSNDSCRRHGKVPVVENC